MLDEPEHTRYHVSFAVNIKKNFFVYVKMITSETSTHDKKDLTALFSAVLVCFVWLKQELMPWWRDIISSFIWKPRPIRQTGSLSLNKTLIVLHFLDTCVKDHSVIKKKHVSCRLHSHFQSRKGHPEFKIEVSCCVRQELPVLSLLNHLSFWPHSRFPPVYSLNRRKPWAGPDCRYVGTFFFCLSVCVRHHW